MTFYKTAANSYQKQHGHKRPERMRIITDWKKLKVMKTEPPNAMWATTLITEKETGH